MDDRERFVYIVKDMLKGDVPSDFYSVRERLNQCHDPTGNQGWATQAMIDAITEAVYLTGTKGTRLHEEFECDREARCGRLDEFVFIQGIYLTFEKSLVNISSFFRSLKNYGKS